MMIERLIESMKAKHKSEPLSLEAYQAWQHNPVTERMMEELEVELMEGALYLADLDSDNIDEAKGGIRAATGVVNWMPQEVKELMPDED